MAPVDLIDAVLSPEDWRKSRRELRDCPRGLGILIGVFLVFAASFCLAKSPAGAHRAAGESHSTLLGVAMTSQAPRDLYEEPVNRHSREQLDELAEVAVTYTYDEPFGEAEVTYIFPAHELIPLAARETARASEQSATVSSDPAWNYVNTLDDDMILLNGQPLKLAATVAAGDCVLLERHSIGTIKSVRPVPPPSEENTSGLQAAGFRRVVGKIKHTANVVVDISYGGETTTSTPDHPFWVVNRNAWVPAGKLHPGDLFQTADGTTIVLEHVSPPRHGTFTVYNLEVEDHHTYHVGNQAVLVHNGPCARKILGAATSLASKLKFTATTAGHMAEKARHVPRQILAYAIETGRRMADPQGAPGAVKIVVEMWKNGTKYLLEIIYRESDYTILHFLYK